MKLLPLLFILILSACSSPFLNEQELSIDPVWIQVASAERQCITPEYSSLEDAINQLKDNGIAVAQSKALFFPVCEACSCPTGIVYQAEIKEYDLDKAAKLGWDVVDEGDDTQE